MGVTDEAARRRLEAAGAIRAETEEMPMYPDEVRRAATWLTSGDTGLSSIVLCAAMLGGDLHRDDHPHDPADLGRCIRLLDRIPEWKPRIGEMAAVSMQWAALVSVWDELEALYRKEEPTGRAPRCYARMRELLEPTYRRTRDAPPQR